MTSVNNPRNIQRLSGHELKIMLPRIPENDFLKSPISIRIRSADGIQPC